ncbi:hypothetical protein F0562_014003 [Nyssa sinensis]|uniref:Uncharacterized protein n=1 Tax=Nyssa sinensis TaxID=561372 RepID=A0A5J4ZRG1_9ASTE|nr:hypothetical protein F0562_014003 [Nyssa sinensis]
MISEDHEIPNGWPLGLNNVSVRLMVEGSQAAAAEPYALHLPSTSFSSFSSSNLDTESTASFFRDQSVSLGRLIGIRQRDRGTLYLPNTVRSEEHENAFVRGSQLDGSKRCGAEMNQGICVPLLLGILEKMSGSKSNSRQ